jgi:hypothetical protein
MNGHYLRGLAPDDLAKRLEDHLGRSVPPVAVAVAQE